jgi:integrase
VGALQNAEAAERLHRQARKNRMLARGYLDWLKHVRHRQHLTVWQYGGKLDSFLAFVGERPLDGLTLDELETWLDRPRRNGAKGAAATLAGESAVIRGFYKYLLGHGHVRTNPCMLLLPPKVRNVNPKAIEDGTWLRVWQADLSDDERVALGLMYFCGLRRAEAAALRVDQVNLERGRLQHFVRKGGGEDVFPFRSAVQLYCERLPHLGAERFLEAFEARVQLAVTAGESFVLAWGTDPRLRQRPFAGPLDGSTNPDQLNKRVGRLQQRLGIKQPFTCHALRHSFVSNLLRMDIPLHVVSRLANHSDVTTTMRYVKTALDPLAEYLCDEGRLVPSRWGASLERQSTPA